MFTSSSLKPPRDGRSRFSKALPAPPPLDSPPGSPTRPLGSPPSASTVLGLGVYSNDQTTAIPTVTSSSGASFVSTAPKAKQLPAIPPPLPSVPQLPEIPLSPPHDDFFSQPLDSPLPPLPLKSPSASSPLAEASTPAPTMRIPRRPVGMKKQPPPPPPQVPEIAPQLPPQPSPSDSFLSIFSAYSASSGESIIRSSDGGNTSTQSSDLAFSPTRDEPTLRPEIPPAPPSKTLLPRSEAEAPQRLRDRSPIWTPPSIDKHRLPAPPPGSLPPAPITQKSPSTFFPTAIEEPITATAPEPTLLQPQLQPQPQQPSSQTQTQRQLPPTPSQHEPVNPSSDNSPNPQIWRRRSSKTERNGEVTDLKLATSHGSTSASQLPTSNPTTTPLRVPLAQSPPTRPPASEYSLFPARDPRQKTPTESASSPTSHSTALRDPHATLAASSDSATNTMGQRVTRIKEKIESMGSSHKQPAVTAVRPKPQAPEPLSRQLKRLPTPDYDKEDIKAQDVSNLVSTVSPASSPEPTKTSGPKPESNPPHLATPQAGPSYDPDELHLTSPRDRTALQLESPTATNAPEIPERANGAPRGFGRDVDKFSAPFPKLDRQLSPVAKQPDSAPEHRERDTAVQPAQEQVPIQSPKSVPVTKTPPPAAEVPQSPAPVKQAIVRKAVGKGNALYTTKSLSDLRSSPTSSIGPEPTVPLPPTPRDLLVSPVQSIRPSEPAQPRQLHDGLAAAAQVQPVDPVAPASALQQRSQSPAPPKLPHLVRSPPPQLASAHSTMEGLPAYPSSRPGSSSSYAPDIRPGSRDQVLLGSPRDMQSPPHGFQGPPPIRDQYSRPQSPRLQSMRNKGEPPVIYRELREEDLPPPDPRALYFPSQHVAVAPGKVFRPPPLSDKHFSCYQGHRNMRLAPNKSYPLSCQTCEREDAECRFLCQWCSLRVCEGCNRMLRGYRFDLAKLLERLDGNPSNGDTQSPRSSRRASADVLTPLREA